jgi:hypothetical protein
MIPHLLRCEASPPSRAAVLPSGSASHPGKEDGHFGIAPLDPALKDWGSALRQHYVSGERAGQGFGIAYYCLTL